MAGKGGKANGRNSGVTIIRREEVIEGGHHGGAWKVAYADFVTAMMAFFLLMWLLNATTEDQRKGLADYFSPNNLMSHASSGVGQPFGGHTVFDHVAMVSDRGAAQVIVGMRPVVQDPPDQDSDTPLTDDAHGAAAQAGPAGKTDAATPGSAEAKSATDAGATNAGATSGATSIGPGPGASSAAAIPGGAGSAGVTTMFAASSGAGSLEAAKLASAAKPIPVVARTQTLPGSRAPTDADIRAAQAAREKLAFEQAAEQIRQAVWDDPALAELSRQLAIDITPEGLRIQLLDADQLPMFTTGSAIPTDRAGLLLAKVAPVPMRLPEAIAVVGHTDAAPYAGNGKTNWELSTERANATRRLLTDKGLAESRVSRVTGLAERDPLVPADPLAAANRRIAIIVLRGTEKPAEPAATKSAPPSIGVPAPASAPPSTPRSVPPSVPASIAGPAPLPVSPAIAGPAPSPVRPSFPSSIAAPAASSTASPAAPAASSTASPAAPAALSAASPAAPAALSAASPVAPAASSAATPAPPITRPFAPSPAPISATLSDPSSARPSDSPAEPAPPDPAPDPVVTPSFVRSFVPSFAPPPHPPSVAAPVPPGPPR